MASVDQIQVFGGHTLSCCRDCDVVCTVCICCRGNLQYVDTAARYHLMERAENTAKAGRCCGVCFVCYQTEVEERFNESIGGTKGSYYKKCCCYCCCGPCRQCRFLRALKAVDGLKDNKQEGGAPQQDEMLK